MHRDTLMGITHLNWVAYILYSITYISVCVIFYGLFVLSPEPHCHQDYRDPPSCASQAAVHRASGYQRVPNPFKMQLLHPRTL